MSAVLASKHQGKGVKMPTIKDIARIAGVSHGTVSNVLNGRGNVSVEKIEAVQRAAREVGLLKLRRFACLVQGVCDIVET